MKLKVAVKVVFCHQGKVLLMADPESKWDFPGGGIDAPERLEEGLRREVREELGWTEFQLGPLVHADEWFIPSLDLHVVAVFYRVDLAEVPERNTLSDEHSEAAWLTPEEVRAHDVTPDTINALEAMGL